MATALTTGYALNRDSTEAGVSAVGLALHRAPGQIVAAFAVAAPSVRFGRLLERRQLDLIRMCQQEIDTDLLTLFTEKGTAE